MKTQAELLSMLFATLAELQSGYPDSNPGLKIKLIHDLELLNEILGDDVVPEEYWEQIEEQLRDEF